MKTQSNRGCAAVLVAAMLVTLAAKVSTAQESFKTLVNFNGSDGNGPGQSPLTQGRNGTFYGTTEYGGAGSTCTTYEDGCGTVFEITPAGALTTLHIFDGTDGANPYAGLVLGTDGNFYGTTHAGGANNNGTVFKIGPTGMLTTLHTFDGTDGANPSVAPIQAIDGNFYGTTQGGGTDGNGTVFEITPMGVLTTLHSFDGTDGSYPNGALVQATDGNFYGTTNYGGVHGYGTVFQITPAGALTTLHSFAGPDGIYPSTAALAQATDGNFYGTTFEGGASGDGTVFKITQMGVLTTLHSFDWTDGANSQSGVVQATDGNFYGTTRGGGASGDGTVFSLAVGLGPFVETLPTTGRVGETVKILGNHLGGATSVSFDGIPATIERASKSEIKTTVPAGATTGTIQVVTPGGTLTSNVAFRVLP